MKNEEFTILLKDCTSINTFQTEELDQILLDFPYFQAARNLHLKALKNQHSFKYNQALKKTAAYTTDRNLLFNYIIDGKVQVDTTPNVASNTATKKLQIGEPLHFNSLDTFSFNEWLQLANFKPINRNPINETEKSDDSNFSLIDKFIKSSPKIKPVKKSNSKKNFSENSTKENIDLMTETLARVYLEQKKFNKAIAAYTILSLKYPEKSSFFADRIKAIKFLQKQNS